MPLDQNPHQTVTRFGYVIFSTYAGGFSVLQMQQIMLVYIPPKIKMSFIWKDDFFAKIGKSNVAIFRRVVQEYTQSYSFGGRIKLIIC